MPKSEVAEKILDGVEASLDVIEEKLDAIEGVASDGAEIVEETAKYVTSPQAWVCRLSRKQHIGQLVGVGVVAAAVGAFVAYKVSKKALETKYEAELKEEIEQAKSFYRHLKTKKDKTPEELASDKGLLEDAVEAVQTYSGGALPQDETEQETATVSNIFTQGAMDPDFDLEEDMANRSEEAPFIITHEEFLEADPGYQQSQLTYYAKDQTLVDEQDQAIPLSDPVVGDINLTRFGHGSGDARMLYIRNDRMNMDFEVALHEGSFAHEVLGLQHSNDPVIERMRRPRQGRDE